MACSYGSVIGYIVVPLALLASGGWGCASRDSAPVVADRPADATPTGGAMGTYLVC